MAERAPVSRSLVLATAVRLADAEGIEAVSMRRLAEELHVVPMALYRHVADKEDLLDGLVDLVLATLPAAAADGDDWPHAFKEHVLAARSAVLSHPWLRRVIETRTRRTAAVLAHMETLTSVLLSGGLSADLAHHAMHALGNRIWGFSPELFNDPSAGAGPARPVVRPSRSPSPDPADYPGILAVAADARGRRPEATGCDEEFEFAFALDLILDGVARLHRAGWNSSQPEA
ncbi:MAG: TetR/AcrR family transcriptional regulator [Nocardioides sp.]